MKISLMLAGAILILPSLLVAPYHLAERDSVPEALLKMDTDEKAYRARMEEASRQTEGKVPLRAAEMTAMRDELVQRLKDRGSRATVSMCFNGVYIILGVVCVVAGLASTSTPIIVASLLFMLTLVTSLLNLGHFFASTEHAELFGAWRYPLPPMLGLIASYLQTRASTAGREFKESLNAPNWFQFPPNK